MVLEAQAKILLQDTNFKENNSQKCKETLIMYNGDSSKKKYKRIHIKNIRWTN